MTYNDFSFSSFQIVNGLMIDVSMWLFRVTGIDLQTFIKNCELICLGDRPFNRKRFLILKWFDTSFPGFARDYQSAVSNLAILGPIASPLIFRVNDLSMW